MSFASSPICICTKFSEIESFASSLIVTFHNETSSSTDPRDHSSTNINDKTRIPWWNNVITIMELLDMSGHFFISELVELERNRIEPAGWALVPLYGSILGPCIENQLISIRFLVL